MHHQQHDKTLIIVDNFNKVVPHPSLVIHTSPILSEIFFVEIILGRCVVREIQRQLTKLTSESRWPTVEHPCIT